MDTIIYDHLERKFTEVQLNFPKAQFPLIFLINSPNINDWSEPDLTINGKTFVCGTLVKSVEDR